MPDNVTIDGGDNSTYLENETYTNSLFTSSGGSFFIVNLEVIDSIIDVPSNFTALNSRFEGVTMDVNMLELSSAGGGSFNEVIDSTVNVSGNATFLNQTDFTNSEITISGTATVASSLTFENSTLTINGATNFLPFASSLTFIGENTFNLTDNADTIDFNFSHLTLNTNAGNDHIQNYDLASSTGFGYASDSVIKTGQGDDFVSLSNADNSRIYTADGNDYLQIFSTSNATIQGGNGDDEFTNFNTLVYYADEHQLYGIDNSHLRGNNGNDSFDLFQAEHVTISGGNGEDSIIAGFNSHDSRYFGNRGDDFIQVEGSNAFVSGGHDNDTINIRNGYGTSTVHGGNDDDIIQREFIEIIPPCTGSSFCPIVDEYTIPTEFDGLESIFKGGNGNDTLIGGHVVDDMSIEIATQETLRGGSGDDLLLGLAGDDTLLGNAHNDTLNGGTGNDLLRGGRGDDTLISHAGNDTLHGGIGDDIFVFGDSTDTGTSPKPGAPKAPVDMEVNVASILEYNATILDFTQNTDLIDLSAIATNFGSLNITVEDGNSTITLNSGIITVNGITDLVEADFIF